MPPARQRGHGGQRVPLAPVLALLVLAFAFAALGLWQVHRLAWKQALVAQVAAGLTGQARDAQTLPSGLAGARAEALAYRKLSLAGTFLPTPPTLVTASTALGSGYWALAPLRLATDKTTGGRVVWVNRGFVPVGTRAGRVATPRGQVRLVGLLRPSEPGGSLLRANRPEDARWYSRDIAAIAAQAGVAGSETGWFVDAGLPAAHAAAKAPDDDEAMAPPISANTASVIPVPGLTVVGFANNHLSYAITWFILAGLSLAGVGVIIRTTRKARE